jgi:hypothetical protein
LWSCSGRAEAQEQGPSKEPTPPNLEAAAPSLIDLSASFDRIRVPPPALISSEACTGNEVFKSGAYSVVRKAKHGTTLFHATSSKGDKSLPGPKHFMQQHASLFNHKAQVVLHSPSQKLDKLSRPIPYRSFALYPSWDIAEPHLQGHKHVFEIVRHGFPCKPYLDIDGKDGHPFRTGADGVRERISTEAVICALEERIFLRFESDYGLNLPSKSFVWLTSGNQHLVISTPHPQFVFASNLEDGTKHLAECLKEKIKPWSSDLAAMIDLSVYSKDREWRAPGCSKVAKPESTLQFINPAHTWRDGLVTWLESPRVSGCFVLQEATVIVLKSNQSPQRSLPDFLPSWQLKLQPRPISKPFDFFFISADKEVASREQAVVCPFCGRVCSK